MAKRSGAIGLAALIFVGVRGLATCSPFGAAAETSDKPAGTPAEQDASSASGGVDARAKPADGDASEPEGDDASEPKGDGASADRLVEQVANLLRAEEATFESGTNCGNISDTNGTKAAVQPGHDSATSCRICADGSGKLFGLNTPDLELGAVNGKTFRATAWISVPVGSTAPPITLLLRSQGSSGGPPVQTGAGSPVAAQENWTKLSTELVVSQSAHMIDVFVEAAAGPTSPAPCFFLDDLVVWRAK